MSYIETFKSYKLDERKALSKNLLQKYPNNVPIIVDGARNSPSISKHKFITNADASIGHFMNEIRKYIELDKSQAMFLFCNNKVLTPSMNINFVYHNNVSDDGFLYVYYAVENVFGH